MQVDIRWYDCCGDCLSLENSCMLLWWMWSTCSDCVSLASSHVLQLIDIETKNGFFTWSNQRSGPKHVARRINRFLISESIMLDDMVFEENSLPKSGSDDWPVSLWLDTRETTKLKPFWFEKFWLTHPDFWEISTTRWRQEEIDHGTCMHKFQQRIKNFKWHLKN